MMKPLYLLVISLAAMALGACVLGTPTPPPSPTPQPEPTAVPTLALTSAQPTAATGQPTTRQYSRVPDVTIDVSARYSAVFRTNQGSFTVELFPAQAPVTVNSFIFLATRGFYDGLTFHRVIEDFMIQGGDPLGTGQGGPGYQYADEIAPRLSFDAPGVLAMANRGGGTSTNGSQFFITTVPTPHLNGNHTIFGRITEGQSVVDAISKVSTGAADRPLSPVIIQSLEIITGAG